MVENETVPATGGTTYQDLENLLNRAWIQRVWTYQEILLANNPIVVCGLTLRNALARSELKAFRTTETLRFDCWRGNIRAPSIAFCLKIVRPGDAVALISGSPMALVIQGAELVSPAFIPDIMDRATWENEPIEECRIS